MPTAALAFAAAVAATAPGKIDLALEGAIAKGFAGEVLVTDPVAVTYSRAVSATGRPHKRGELWRWASVTKQLTATLTMQAVSAGRLSLDDTVGARLRAFKGPSANRVTIRMLLRHTSGLPNPDDTAAATERDFPAFYRRTRSGAGGAADALGYCAGPAKGPPGEAFAYNNCDFIVLGAILERATGKPYALLARDALARPNGLATLRIATKATDQRALVKGVMEDGSPEPPFNLATFGAAGAAYGSSDDLARFDRALLNGTLLDKAATAASWAGEPKLGYVALGVWSFPAPLKGCEGPVKLVERRGEIGGVEVRNLLAPERKLALIVFADRAGIDFGEIWQGKGLTYDLASAAFCG
ncbi:serine hydrolase [uncultured Caulobacter sp.]|uniref:serine hydrolase domain-containing protein n=1 Tax=uncultured Caulobacter sp. TaxID=158749 RepID=UPI00261D2568|nr:serine hydrolase [uncultured Caulobacter sp.]